MADISYISVQSQHASVCIHDDYYSRSFRVDLFVLILTMSWRAEIITRAAAEYLHFMRLGVKSVLHMEALISSLRRDKERPASIPSCSYLEKIEVNT